MRAYCIVREGRGESHFQKIINFNIVHVVSKHLMCVGIGYSTRTAERVAQNITLP